MTLSQRLFVYFFGIFLLIFGTICFFQYEREKTFRTDELNSQLTTYNATIYRFLTERNPSWEMLDEYTHLFPDSLLRITVIDTLGNVIFDSFVNKHHKLSNHLDRPEIKIASHAKLGTAIRRSQSTGISYYYMAQRFPRYFVRSALPYNVSLAATLKANTSFIYFMFVLLLLGAVSLYFISRNFTKSIKRLKIFIKKAENEDISNTEMIFPKDELGEISQNIIKLYKLQLQTKTDLKNEREKLIKHLQISFEGLAIFSSEKEEILANQTFIQYINLISDNDCKSSDQLFSIPEFTDVSKFIDENLSFRKETRKKFVIEKSSRIFSVQCIVFQDDSFEISINDISVQEHENQLKKQLTQNISHELKTPVSSILGYMESILGNPDLTQEKQLFFIERSFQQAQRLRNLLQDISMLNKIEEGKLIYETENCLLVEVVSDVVSDVHLQIEQKKNTVFCQIDPNLVIRGNRSLLYSIFRNLFDNTLAYAGENVKIEINCYREDDQFAYISFSDNGTGVAPEHLNRLFDRFYRVDKGRSRKMGGTGLGLAIVKNAVWFHQGNISAKINAEGGLTLMFSLKK